jgi:hypothetical protein
MRTLTLLVAALLAGPGCTRHHIVSVDELRTLDGYIARRGDERPLKTNEGNTIWFDSAADLWLLGPEPEVRGHFRAIKLTPTAFEGVLVGSGALLRADVASIHFAKVQGVDVGLSLTLTGIIVGVAAGVIYGYLILRPPPVF